MAMNSVNTNMGAMVALQSLNRTGADMATTQKAIATGFRVADAKDDGAAFAIAQRVRSNVGALTSVNRQLASTKELINTTVTSLKNVTDTLKEMKDTLGTLANSGVSGQDRANNIAAYRKKLESVRAFVADASYNGKTLIADLGSGAAQADKDAIGYADITVARNENGSTSTITAVDLKAELDNINYTDAQLNDAVQVAAELGASGQFNKTFDKVGTTSNVFGTQHKYFTDQISFNQDKIDALNAGVGALVDADMSKEAANLQALQVRQQLGTQALSIANQAPQSLLSLFR